MADVPCFARVPGEHAFHSCHLRVGHQTRHLAILCGAGHRGGRRARWTCAEDLQITGKGVLDSCGPCREPRRTGDNPTVRTITRTTEVSK